VETSKLHAAAAGMIEAHGIERALEICETSENEMYEAGNLLGLAAWRGIKSAIQDLQSRPAPGTKLN
jgi:hypothetical protein